MANTQAVKDVADAIDLLIKNTEELIKTNEDLNKTYEKAPTEEVKNGIDKNNDAIKQQSNEIKKLIRAKNALIKAQNGEVDALEEVRKATRRTKKENDLLLKSRQQNGESLTAMRSKLSLLTKEYVEGNAETRAKTLPLIKSLRREVLSLEKAIGQHQREVGNYRKAWSGLMDLFLAGGLVGAIMSVASALKNVIASGREFERQMNRVKAVSGATRDEFILLREDALRLGAVTEYTATEVARLQERYAQKGFSPTAIIAATEATIDLATASGEDLAGAADVASAVLGAFNMTASSTSKVTDVMAKSFSESALNLEKFRESSKMAAPAANAAGISIERMTADLSALADAGIHGTMAGTALRRIYTDLTIKGGDVAKSMELMAKNGITIADANDEVGRTAQNALLILADYNEKITELEDSYEGASGAAKDMADIVRDDLQGDLDKLNSTFDGIGQKISKVLTPGLRYLTQALDTALNPKTYGQQMFGDLERMFDDIPLSELQANREKFLDAWLGSGKNHLRRQEELIEMYGIYYQKRVSDMSRFAGETTEILDKQIEALLIKQGNYITLQQAAGFSNEEIMKDSTVMHYDEMIAILEGFVRENEKRQEDARKRAEVADKKAKEKELERQKKQNDKLRKEYEKWAKQKNKIINQSNKEQVDYQTSLYNEIERIDKENRQAMQTILQNELDDIESARDAELRIIKNGHREKLIAEEDYLKKINETNARYDAERDAAKERDEERQQASVISYQEYASSLSQIASVAGSIAQTIADSYSNVIDYQNQRINEEIAVLNAEIQKSNAGLASSIDQQQQKIAELQEERDRAVAKQQQYVQISQALSAIENGINLTVAVSSLFRDGTLKGGIPGVAIAAGMAATMLSLVASLNAQAQQNAFADGVIDLKGPGTEKSDSIFAKLSRGESVMTAKETRESRGILEAIRSNKINDAELAKLVAVNDVLSVQSDTDKLMEIKGLSDNTRALHSVTGQLRKSRRGVRSGGSTYIVSR